MIFRRYLLVLAFVLCTKAVWATEASAADSPPDFKMSMACFSDTISTKPEWIFVVGGTAFRTLEALKEGITHFPKGSTLTWAPSCKRMGGEPLSTEAELKDFVAHCSAHGIRFILVPAG